MHTLVTFLGRARDNPATGYRETTYRFPDGTERRTAFFGLALAEHLRPDTLVILGTRGSQWGVLVWHVAGHGDEGARLELIDAEAEARVDQALLDRVAPLLSRATGRPVAARLIPYGRDEAEQRSILDCVAQAVIKGQVSFDLTHGFRHLGMVGFLSAFMLERIGNLDVKALWYGALDMTENGLTPVLRLDGLTAVQRWIEALDRFDATGDYGVFAPLLLADGVPVNKTKCLSAAAFHERVFNLRDAACGLRTFLPVLDDPLPGASGLFQRKLGERLRWVGKDSLYEHQRSLAYVYLNRRDYVRAAVLAWEAVITRECQQCGLDPEDFGEDGERGQAEAMLKARLQQQGTRWAESPHRRLKDLRNSLAHASAPWSPEVRKALADPDQLFKLLEADIKRVLG